MKVKAILWTYKKHVNGTHDIKIYLSGQGKKKYISTGHSILPEQWNGAKGTVRRNHPFYKDINAALNRKIEELSRHFINGGTIQTLGKKNKGSFLDFIEKYIEDVNKGKYQLAISTAKNYSYTLNRMKSFCQTSGRKDLSFEDINLDFYFDFKDYLHETGCNLPGIGKHFKIIKKFMNEALSLGLHNNRDHQHTSFKAHRERASNKIYLTGDEIQKMEKLDLKDHPHLERERDRFLISYYMLMRYSDSIRIKEDYFFENDGTIFYRNISQKTGKESVVPVKPAVYKILKRRNFDISGDTNQEANRKLKVIASMAGINQPATEGSRKGPKSIFVTTHTARRSAATNLAMQNVSLKIIADLGGWVKIDSLRTYLRLSGIDSAITARELDFFK